MAWWQYLTRRMQWSEENAPDSEFRSFFHRDKLKSAEFWLVDVFTPPLHLFCWIQTDRPPKPPTILPEKSKSSISVFQPELTAKHISGKMWFFPFSPWNWISRSKKVEQRGCVAHLEEAGPPANLEIALIFHLKDFPKLFVNNLMKTQEKICTA